MNLSVAKIYYTVEGFLLLLAIKLQLRQVNSCFEILESHIGNLSLIDNLLLSLCFNPIFLKYNKMLY